MHTIIQIFSACGSLVLGCAIIVFTGCASAFSGAALGFASAVGLLGADENTGLAKGLPLGGLLGVVWAIYSMCVGGLASAFLASLGLAAVMLILAGLVCLFFPGTSSACDPDSPDC